MSHSSQPKFFFKLNKGGKTKELTISWKAILSGSLHVNHSVENKERIRRVLNQMIPPSDSSASTAAINRKMNANKKSLRRTGNRAPTYPTSAVPATIPPMMVPAIIIVRRQRRKRQSDLVNTLLFLFCFVC